MIYIDPPYNTGHDFIYKDKFRMDEEDYAAQTELFDEEGNKQFAENNDSNPRFHSDWCSMIYPRLLLARNLLSDDGIIFISIDDHEQAVLKMMCNEIFGEDNFIACFPRITKKSGKTTEAIANNHDYVLMFSKTSLPQIYLPMHTDSGFKYADEYEQVRGKYKLNQTLDYDSLQYSPSLDYPIELNGETFYPGSSYEKYVERQNGHHNRADWAWRWSKELFEFGYQNGFITIKKYKNHSRIYTKTYQNAQIIKDANGFHIDYKQRTKSISTLLFTENQFSNDSSKKSLTQLFNGNIFDYSKPISLLKELVCFSTKGNDIILDFFSGSATTAHAVMQLNAEDGGRRKFIMVQLPEKCDEKSEAYKAGYRTICDIGKERIRRAGEKIQQEHPDVKLDTGFRVFRVDSANMEDVYYSAGDYAQESLAGLTSNIKPDRSALDVFFGCVLDWGLPLDRPYETEEIAGYAVHNYDHGALLACFADAVSEELIRAMAQRRPLRAVFRDSSFPDSPSKINTEEIFKMYSPLTKIKVI